MLPTRCILDDLSVFIFMRLVLLYSIDWIMSHYANIASIGVRAFLSNPPI